MKIGLLWWNDDPKATLDAKIQGAAAYYAKKYGNIPNVCYVNPAQQGTLEKAGEIAIRTHRSILPNHLWIGVEEIRVNE